MMNILNEDIVGDEDTDEEVSAIFANINTPRMKPSTSGVVIAGEASESESEEEINLTANKCLETTVNNDRMNLRNMKKIVIQDFATEESVDLNPSEGRRQSIKYNSLLHKRLREKNASLHKHLSNLIQRPFYAATGGIWNVTQQLIKTQILIQELSPMLRQMTNELFYFEDKVDFIKDYTCAMPQINYN